MTFLQRFLVAWRLVSQLDTGSQNKSGAWSMKEENLTALALFGHTLKSNGEKILFENVASMESTKAMVIKAAVKKIFDTNYFSICDLDNVINLVGSRKQCEAYSLLKALHCIDYQKMPQDLRDRIPMLINECLMVSSGVDSAVNTSLDGIKL